MMNGTNRFGLSACRRTQRNRIIPSTGAICQFEMIRSTERMPAFIGLSFCNFKNSIASPPCSATLIWLMLNALRQLISSERKKRCPRR